jgi:hypothetical protein
MTGADLARDPVRYRANVAVIEKSGTRFQWERGEAKMAMLFREPDRPQVDFYPASGKWRICGHSECMDGGADRFLEWYASQRRLTEGRTGMGPGSPAGSIWLTVAELFAVSVAVAAHRAKGDSTPAIRSAHDKISAAIVLAKGDTLEDEAARKALPGSNGEAA